MVEVSLYRAMANVRTPRPTPVFFNKEQTFSTKKERSTPRDCPPPKPPVKSAPPISRIFQTKPQLRAQPVSFKDPDHSAALSPNYNENIRDLYFDQCFTIESKLGAGSFGEVYKVKSKEDGRFYAVKRSRERFRGESDRQRKLEEVAKHEHLPKHPNCVHFVKAWEERQHLYIQTELCKNSLSQYSETNHNIPETLVWNYVVDLLMAVKHLHDYDLVHMDIKPDNIFIAEDGTCKLGDFGLVLDLNKCSDMSEAQEGDPKYMAPELMLGKFSKKADIFSLGITLLELATDLDLPRGGNLWHQLRSANLPEQFLKGVSYDFKWIVRLMMEPDPQRRPSASQLLQKPCVKNVWKKRRREQVYKKVKRTLASIYQAIVGLFLLLWFSVCIPLKKVFPKKLSTPQKIELPKQATDWDHSFSDDECFGTDDSINLSNNSLVGQPLDSSTASEGDLLHDNSFQIPSVPLRKVFTTPGLRHRHGVLPFSPHSSSPINLNYSRSITPTSPNVNGVSNLNVSVTPSSTFQPIPVVEDDLPKLGIEPKNLLEAFESASSEDDCLE